MTGTEYQQPQSLEAERNVIGAIIKSEDAMTAAVATLRTSAPFYAQKHRIIFDAAIGLYRNSNPVDITTLGERMLQDGHLQKVGGRMYLVECAEGVITTANTKSYCEIILDKYRARQIQSACNEAIKQVHLDSSSKVADHLMGSLFSITQNQSQGFQLLSSESMKLVEYYDRCETKAIDNEVILTGFPEVDTQFPGFEPGELIILAGVEKHGKTAMALEIAINNAAKGKKVAILSLEMMRQQLLRRRVFGEAGLDPNKVRGGALTDKEKQDMMTALDRVRRSDVYVSEDRDTTIEQLIAQAMQLKQSKGLDLLIVDYLQLMEHSVGETEEQKINKLAKSLRTLGGRINIPVIALSQFNNQIGVADKPDRRFLRGSGSIKQHMDAGLSVWQDEGGSWLYCLGARNWPKFNPVKLKFEHARWYSMWSAPTDAF